MRTILIALAMMAPPTAGGAELVVTVWDGNEPLADAVVWAVAEGAPMPPAPAATAVMDQINRTFVPHVLPVQLGAAVRFPNSDNIRHQVYSFSSPKTFQLPLYIGEPANPVVFDRPGAVALGCNIHDQMSAWIVVVETTVYGKSAADGRVMLSAMDDGPYLLHVWHPQMAEARAPLSIPVPDAGIRELTVDIRPR